MQKFTYIIESDISMHFGPAGRLAEIAQTYPDCTATLTMVTREANISRPMKVATMGIRKGDAVTVTVEGESEVEMIDVLHHYFADHL